MKLFFLKYLILIISLIVVTDPIYSNVVSEESNLTITAHFSNLITCGNHDGLMVQPNSSNLPKNGEVLENHNLNNINSYKLKKKYFSQYRTLFLIYSRRKKSLDTINSHAILSIINVSPLSLILQI